MNKLPRRAALLALAAAAALISAADLAAQDVRAKVTRATGVPLQSRYASGRSATIETRDLAAASEAAEKAFAGLCRLYFMGYNFFEEKGSFVISGRASCELPYERLEAALSALNSLGRAEIESSGSRDESVMAATAATLETLKAERLAGEKLFRRFPEAACLLDEELAELGERLAVLEEFRSEGTVHLGITLNQRLPAGSTIEDAQQALRAVHGGGR